MICKDLELVDAIHSNERGYRDLYLDAKLAT